MTSCFFLSPAVKRSTGLLPQVDNTSYTSLLLFTGSKFTSTEFSTEISTTSSMMSEGFSKLSGPYSSMFLWTLTKVEQKWHQANRTGSDKILCIKPQSKYTISESPEFLLGKVDKIWVVTNQSDSSGKPLKVRAKTRLSQRKEPSASSFDEYMAVRNSCWILEERNGDYFCDCPKGS